MEKTKGWDEFFNKEHKLIKENKEINVLPNQISIIYEEDWEEEGVLLTEGGYYLKIKTPKGIFLTKVFKQGEFDDESEG